ncbi:unnamed protein product [Arctia plantaginis]|uniref:Uncharacterized protein n=1 Tax=Arctia plantaginis TaxID=874455 RepID=A0A8S0YUD9_ARCPL|nr:unnamed protein product [Arctia plantaginis]CAB3257670.1 unnamed protein product [Arctia plantaginis]
MSEEHEEEQVITNQPLSNKQTLLRNAPQVIQDDGSTEACLECCCAVAETTAEIASDSNNDNYSGGDWNCGDCDCGDCSCFGD